MRFTHYWVSGFGWENTIYQKEDFDNIEELGTNDEGVIFIAFNGKARHILKGYYE